MPETIFHVALAVNDLEKARGFYMETLGCKERSDTSGTTYSVINFYGAQLVIIEAPEQVGSDKSESYNEPAQHFGIIMDWKAWHSLAAELRVKGVKFLIEPNIKDHPHIGEVGNMFLADPSGNCVEFKSYKDQSMVL